MIKKWSRYCFIVHPNKVFLIFLLSRKSVSASEDFMEREKTATNLSRWSNNRRNSAVEREENRGDTIIKADVAWHRGAYESETTRGFIACDGTHNERVVYSRPHCARTFFDAPLHEWIQSNTNRTCAARSRSFTAYVHVFRTVTAKARILAPVRLLVARIFVRCISHFRHSIPIRSRIRFVLITQRDFISIPTIFLFFFFFTFRFFFSYFLSYYWRVTVITLDVYSRT